MAEFLFDSRGAPIAFRRTRDDKFLFNIDGFWIGWFPWNDADAVTPDGDYLGSNVSGRLLRRNSPAYRGNPGCPGNPGVAGYAGYPGSAGYGGTPPGYADIPDRLLTGY